MSVAVIGAGMAGLACARALLRDGEDVRVFDKGRAPGGRASTRRHDVGSFDHGAQYLTARDPSFRHELARWRRAGLVAPWAARLVSLRRGQALPVTGGTRRYVGVPGMSALARHMARDLDVRRAVLVERLVPAGDGWELLGRGADDVDTRSLGRFERVIVTVPADQARALAPAGSDLEERVRGLAMQPCVAVMLALAEPYEVPFDGAFVRDSPLCWVARDSSKPGRAPGDRWVLHAEPSWSLAHLGSAAGDRVDGLVSALEVATGVPLPARSRATAHTWRYALAEEPLDEGLLVDALPGLAWAGAWCHGSRVEGAWLSGRPAARWARGAAVPFTQPVASTGSSTSGSQGVAWGARASRR